MELQHLIVKIPVQGPLGIDPAKVVDIFHRWVATQSVPGVVLVDVAELLHVPDGPGVVAVGVEADFALDHTGGTWGVLYRSKVVVKGSNADRIGLAFEAANRTGVLLEEAFGSALKFSREEFELIVNDRGIAPNTPATYAAVQPEIEAALRSLLGHGEFELARHDREPRQRFGLTVKSARPFELAAA
jgi:hypothetical protein